MDIKSSYNKHKSEIEARLQEFSQLNNKERIKELFFCILTPQSNAEKCWHAVEQLKNCRLEEKNKDKIENCLKTKTRFYRNKTRYILEANKNWQKIEKLIKSNNHPIETRNLLADNVKGLGMKEASHFLRNIDKSNNKLAILDRHVLRKMQELNLIQDIKIKNKKNYLEIENKMKEFAKSVKIPLDHLDLLFWKLESGRIFK